MENESEINERISRKNKEITRQFLMSIDENVDLLDKPTELKENPELKEINTNVKSFFSSLNDEGFFKTDKMKNSIEGKILQTLNSSDSKLGKLVKSDEFNFVFDLAKPFIIDIIKKFKEKGAEA